MINILMEDLRIVECVNSFSDFLKIQYKDAKAIRSTIQTIQKEQDVND